MVVVSLGISLPSEAKKKRSESLTSEDPNASQSSFSTGSEGSRRKLLLSGGLGFYGPSSGTMWVDDKGSAGLGLSGIIALAAEGEMFLDHSLSGVLGFRYYSSSDDRKLTATTTTIKESLWTLGAQGKVAFFNDGTFSAYLGFGLGLVSGTSKTGNAEELAPGIGFGVSQTMGLLYKVNPRLEVGAENFRILGLGSAYNGWLVSDVMFKVRIAI